MKKRILTFSLFAVGLVLVLFLLLPFLETTAPNTATDAAQAKKASPQIFTSNPLTDLVNRIARFFGNSEYGRCIHRGNRTVSVHITFPYLCICKPKLCQYLFVRFANALVCVIFKRNLGIIACNYTVTITRIIYVEIHIPPGGIFLTAVYHSFKEKSPPNRKKPQQKSNT